MTHLVRLEGLPSSTRRLRSVGPRRDLRRLRPVATLEVIPGPVVGSRGRRRGRRGDTPTPGPVTPVSTFSLPIPLLEFPRRLMDPTVP